MKNLLRQPRRPARLYPIGTSIRTKYGIFRVVADCAMPGCRRGSYWSMEEAFDLDG